MAKKKLIVLSAALAILFLDQLTKFLIRQSLQPNQPLPIITNVLQLTYITNTGSAFGLFKGLNIFFILFSIAVVAAIFYYLGKTKEEKKALHLCIGLLLGGTIGNLIDRVFYGAVTDFIDFRIWPVFNIADSAVTIGIILLIAFLWKK